MADRKNNETTSWNADEVRRQQTQRKQRKKMRRTRFWAIYCAGVVLGYDVGAAVTELDTYQRATMLPKGYGCPGMNGINSSGAHEINALGERFMGKYDPMWENGVRNNQIQGTFQDDGHHIPHNGMNSSKDPARLSIWICGMWTKPWFASCRTS